MSAPSAHSAPPLQQPLLHPPEKSPRTQRCSWTVIATFSLVAAFGASALFSAAEIAHGVFYSPMFKPRAPVPLAASASEDEVFLHRGVNLGGWLIVEPWTTPSMIYPFLCVGGQCPAGKPPVIDERSFCDRLGPEKARRELERFRSQWVTEATFERIAAAGLNTVRVPFGYWIFGDTDLCPGVPSIHHLDDAVRWAEKHGLRVVLDLHGVYPTQNGMDHSGTSSHEPFAHGALHGWNRSAFDGRDWLRPENAARSRAVLRRIAKRYAGAGAVHRLGMVNEPMLMDRVWCDSNCPVRVDELLEYYDATWQELQPELGAKQHPILDVGLGGSIWQWADAVIPPSLRRGVLDVHAYQAWAPYGMLVPQALHLRYAACDMAGNVRALHEQLLPVMVGEWSVALTDCAPWLNGVGLSTGDANTGIQAQCVRVPCPTRFNDLPPGVSLHGGPDADGLCTTGLLPSQGSPMGALPADDFYRLLTEYMMAAFEDSAGWLFWNFDNEMGDPRWSFFEAQQRGWFPANLSVSAYTPRLPDCSAPDLPFFGDFLSAAAVCATSLLALLLAAVGYGLSRFGCCGAK